MSDRIITYITTAVLATVLVWFFAFSGNKKPVDTVSMSDDRVTGESEGNSNEGEIVAPTPQLEDGNVGVGVGRYPPAECSVSGSIKYLEPGLYENNEALIEYKNIDSEARLVKWTITPNDDLSVGPNLFAAIPIPDGAEDVTVGLPDSPVSRNYVLTAAVTYGKIVNRNLEIRESSCSGQIPISIKF